MQPRHAAAPAVAGSARLERRRAQGSAAEQALALYRAIFVKATEAIAIIERYAALAPDTATHHDEAAGWIRRFRGEAGAWVKPRD